MKSSVCSTITISLKREVLDQRRRATGFKYEFADGSIVDSDSIIPKTPAQDSQPPKPGNQRQNKRHEQLNQDYLYCEVKELCFVP